MNRNKLHGLRQRTAADSLIGELLDALLDDGPAAEAAAVQVDAGAVSWSSWPRAVVVDGAKLAECRREIAQARELLQAIAERFQ